MRILGFGSVAGLVGVVGVASAITLRDHGATRVTETAGGTVALQEKRPTAKRVSPTTPSVPTAADSSHGAPATTPVVAPSTGQPAAASAPAAPAPGTSVGLILIQGRTTLTDSIFATRTGDSVVVNFDTQGNRTRRADKFERTVRATLPLVYGHGIARTLDSIPQGTLVPPGDLVGDLQTAGIHLLLGGIKITVMPRSRVGRDGALVIAYRTNIER